MRVPAAFLIGVQIHGALRNKFLDSLVVADVDSIPVGHSKLSVFTNDKGGIIDDTMITNAGDYLYHTVINTRKSFDWM